MCTFNIRFRPPCRSFWAEFFAVLRCHLEGAPTNLDKMGHKLKKVMHLGVLISWWDMWICWSKPYFFNYRADFERIFTYPDKFGAKKRDLTSPDLDLSGAHCGFHLGIVYAFRNSHISTVVLWVYWSRCSNIGPVNPIRLDTVLILRASSYKRQYWVYKKIRKTQTVFSWQERLII